MNTFATSCTQTHTHTQVDLITECSSSRDRWELELPGWKHSSVLFFTGKTQSSSNGGSVTSAGPLQSHFTRGPEGNLVFFFFFFVFLNLGEILWSTSLHLHYFMSGVLPGLSRRGDPITINKGAHQEMQMLDLGRGTRGRWKWFSFASPWRKRMFPQLVWKGSGNSGPKWDISSTTRAPYQ